MKNDEPTPAQLYNDEKRYAIVNLRLVMKETKDQRITEVIALLKSGRPSKAMDLWYKIVGNRRLTPDEDEATAHLVACEVDVEEGRYIPRLKPLP